ncbi:HEAT repeat domain-containing protein [Desulfatitalea alkaliphila]|uniref:HEAT repeat domain-containing protein n=1 Tax=Desulfatitalea alkaliphila TaxID=2929485 RepID=A0AA41UID3_9BACT|nr:HEAT repeat domain-containing protein [Desulfatitalea alkaliphila]MCJ8499964.1 HEAT repeat domain-containing protein [Desulfatitalea alkaliphila]
MHANETHSESAEPSLIRQVATALSGAYKKRNLYDPEHTIYQSALDGLMQLCDRLFAGADRLQLTIAQDGIRHREAMILEGAGEPTDLTFILHRDGLLSLTLRRGLQRWELDTLVSIWHEHAVLPEDAEEDIVTALWQLDLPSVSYEAAAPALGPITETPLTDLEKIWNGVVNEEDGAPAETPAHNENRTADAPHAMPIAPLAQTPALFRISADERIQLRKMVASEERMDGTAQVVAVLLYILTHHHCSEEDIADLLDTLFQELHETLGQGRFHHLHDVLLKLQQHTADLERRQHGTARRLRCFLDNLADATFLNALLTLMPPMDQRAPSAAKQLKKLFLLLGHSTLPALGAMMMHTSSAALQRLLLETIATFAHNDLAPVAALIQGGNNELAARLVYVLGYLKDDDSRRMLSGLLGHPAAPVRRQALKAISAHGRPTLEELFALMDDPDPTVRKCALQELGRERNRQVEQHLLARLAQPPPGDDGDEHLMALHQVLGRSGSEQSLPYLRRLLFRWPLLGILRPAAGRQRRAAVTALSALDPSIAAPLLRRNSSGFWKNLLRSAKNCPTQSRSVPQ